MKGEASSQTSSGMKEESRAQRKQGYLALFTEELLQVSFLRPCGQSSDIEVVARIPHIVFISAPETYIHTYILLGEEKRCQYRYLCDDVHH